MNRYDILTAVGLASKSRSESQPSSQQPLAAVTTAFKSKRVDKTSSDEEIRLYMLQRIQPSPITPWNSHNVPRYVYHVTTRNEWMRCSETYEGLAEDQPGCVKCVDECRLDALVSRKFFREQYESGIARLNSTSARLWRKFTSVLGVGSNDAIECVERAYGAKTTRNNVATMDESMVEDTNRVLIVIDTRAFDTDGFIRWEKPHQFPCITRTLNKNLDACFDYPLRYCTHNLRLALPSEAQLAERAEALNNSGKYCEDSARGIYNRIY